MNEDDYGVGLFSRDIVRKGKIFPARMGMRKLMLLLAAFFLAVFFFLVVFFFLAVFFFLGVVFLVFFLFLVTFGFALFLGLASVVLAFVVAARIFRRQRHRRVRRERRHGCRLVFSLTFDLFLRGLRWHMSKSTTFRLTVSVCPPRSAWTLLSMDSPRAAAFSLSWAASTIAPDNTSSSSTMRMTNIFLLLLRAFLSSCFSS